MPEIVTLSAERRAQAGKGAARETRRQGRVPGIIYGGEGDPLLISLESRELSRAVAQRGFLAMVVELRVGDVVHRALPRDVQYHPATDQPLHVDFMRVGVDTQVTVTVPVAFINHEMSIGLRRGGILNIVRHGVALICQVDDIPEQLVADLDGLDIGDSVHISAVTLPRGSRLAITDRDFTIASIAASSAVREEAATAATAPPPAPEQPAATAT
ncbi:MAG: 50S ribosomal protein L25/general stress protein Ctc [Alphaproteobacteria bacterium]|nr:50S ribosomal protein L25/general stress protein Ctc [Alphaproteobacteria bacterium]